MKTLAAILTIGLLASNMAWMRADRAKSAELEQSSRNVRNAQTAQDNRIYRLTDQHNNNEIGITCKNGADPAGIKVDSEMVLMSCGQ